MLSSHGQEIVTLSTARWTGQRLTIESTSTYPDGRRIGQTQVWSIDAEGRLIIELTQRLPNQEPTTQRLVHHKGD